MTDPAIWDQLQVDKQSDTPIYRQLEKGLARLIKAGAWQRGEALPSETVIAELFQISVMTVRQAMTQLVTKGLIYREKGRGTFVASQPLVHSLQRLESFSEDMEARGLVASSRILLFETCLAPADVALRLQVEIGTPVLHIKRVRLADYRPVGLHDAYLRPEIFIDRFTLETEGSLYRVLENLGIHLREAEEHLDAIVADAELAALLKVPKGAPLLEIVRTSYDERQVAIETINAVYRANFYRYTVHLSR